MPDREALWSKAKDLLVIIVIPAVIWITSSILELRESRATSEKQVEYIQHRAQKVEQKVHDLSDKTIRLESVQKDVIDISGTLGTLSTKDNSLEVKVTRLESKMESVGDDIKDIKSMVKVLVKKTN